MAQRHLYPRDYVWLRDSGSHLERLYPPWLLTALKFHSLVLAAPLVPRTKKRATGKYRVWKSLVEAPWAPLSHRYQVCLYLLPTLGVLKCWV